jgi:hypothetical protein
MHSSIQGFQTKISAFALALLLAGLWLLLRGYHGITDDGQIYAFQAIARIHPHLASDLYLQNTSQDRFTAFSPFYAGFIEILGLEHAARFLTLLFTVWLFAAAFSAARAIGGRDCAWLAVACLLITAGNYGGSGVFRFAEDFLTARLPAEALIVTSLLCYLRGRKRLAVAVATLALFVHPLIALPGLLLLLCLSLPNQMIAVGAIGGILATLAIASVAANVSWASRVLPMMDPAWLGVVQERSQFLFLQLWSFRDWTLNARPFFCLALTALAVRGERVHKLCVAAAVVGATGLAVAAVASLIGPIALLVQGQAWRWVWITVFVSILLLPATVLQIWRDKKCGPLCSLLLVAGWTMTATNGLACVSLALVLWATRETIGDRTARLFRWVFLALLVAAVAWILLQYCGFATSMHVTGESFVGAVQSRDTFTLRLSAALLVAMVWRIARINNIWSQIFLAGALFAMLIFDLPAALRETRTLGAAADVAEFSDWERVIPSTSTVLVTPARDVGAFVWFTLGRPNYLAVDQSAGVVFSRDTALEVQRRSQVLLPLMDPNWKILTKLHAIAADEPKSDAPSRPLTALSLSQVCSDSQLAFVISPENIGFDPLGHESAGPWKGWNLYDCRKARPPSKSEY